MTVSLSIAALSIGAERLFVRLISKADDQGRLPGDPRQVKGLCLPIDENSTTADVSAWLQELVEQRMILAYTLEERALIQVVNWWRYQDAMRRARPSKWAPPPGWSDRLYGFEGAPAKLESLSEADRPTTAAPLGPGKAVGAPGIGRGLPERVSPVDRPRSDW